MSQIGCITQQHCFYRVGSKNSHSMLYYEHFTDVLTQFIHLNLTY